MESPLVSKMSLLTAEQLASELQKDPRTTR